MISMQYLWSLVGFVAAVVIWGGCALCYFSPFLQRQLTVLTERARTAPVRSALGAIVVGIAIAYGGTKPPSPVLPLFSYKVVGDTVTLLTVTNSPTSSELLIPEAVAEKPVTALAPNFCQGAVAAKFTSVSIPSTITSIGDGFFSPDGSGRKSLQKISVDRNNVYCAVTADDVLYELDTGRVIYAVGDIQNVRFSVSYIAKGWEGEGYTDYKLYGVALPLGQKMFTKSGWIQTGWSTSSSGTTKDFELGEIYDIDKSLKLYPFGTNLQIHVVHFDKNGPDVVGEMKDQEFKVDKVSTLSPCSFSRPGYTFAGWSEAPTFGQIYTNNTPMAFSSSGERTFYAAWVREGCYAMSFDPEDGNSLVGTGSIEYLHVMPGKVEALPKEGLAPPAGYRLTGWKRIIDDKGGKRYDPGLLVFNLLDETGVVVRFRAIWEK